MAFGRCKYVLDQNDVVEPNVADVDLSDVGDECSTTMSPRNKR
jgi:hypothetical protein